MRSHKDQFEDKWITSRDGHTMFTRISRTPVPLQTTTIVMVHGLSVSSGYMLPTAIQLAPHFRVYIPDLPGFGRSPDPSHILNVSELADVLAAWMQAIGLESATLLGNSLGGQIIARFALKYPERLERAILVSPTMDPRIHTTYQALGHLLLDAPCEPPFFLPVLLREYFIAGIPRTLRTLHYAFADPIEEHLAHMTSPTLVVRGERDPIVSQPWAEKVNHLLTNSQLIVVPGAGHAVNFNSPKALTDVVRAFMDHTPAFSQ